MHISTIVLLIFDTIELLITRKRIIDKLQKIPLERLVPGLIIGPASWLGPYIVASSLFLPAMLQRMNAHN